MTILRAVGRRWPTIVALALSLDFWWDPFVPPVWTLLLCQAVYLFCGRKAPRLQLIMFGVYCGLALLITLVSHDLAMLLIAAGWGAHAVWDFVHHRRNAVVPRWWAEWCGVFDLVVALTILIAWI